MSTQTSLTTHSLKTTSHSSARRICVVSDDSATREVLADWLNQYGYWFSILKDCDSLDEKLEILRPDLIVLDMKMQTLDGLTILRRLRDFCDGTPVIILTHRAGDLDKIIALEAGADDYVAKPFNPRELVARIAAVLRWRTAVITKATQPVDSFSCAEFSLDFKTRVLSCYGRNVTLSESEFILLKAFVSNPMQILARDNLSNLMNGISKAYKLRNIDVQVWRLRRVMQGRTQPHRFIQTVHGRGYIFVPSGDAIRGKLEA